MQLRSREGYLSSVFAGRPRFYVFDVVSATDSGPVADLERPLPLLGVQRLEMPAEVVRERQLADTGIDG